MHQRASADATRLEIIGGMMILTVFVVIGVLMHFPAIMVLGVILAPTFFLTSGTATEL